MIVDNAKDFTAAFNALDLPADRPAFPTQLMLVRPDGFVVSEQTAQDNLYMHTELAADENAAIAQHEKLAQALRQILPVTVFAGSAKTPDAVFPNNVFASANGRLIIGAMRHAERQAETHRADIRDWFLSQDYQLYELNQADVVAELTGALVIDRARGIGFCGLTERCNRAGASAMHQAFDLRLSFVFDLAAGEYHSNVVLAVLAGRAVILHQASFADPQVAEAIAQCYSPHIVWLSDAEKLAFCGNAIAVSENIVWMSAAANRALSAANRQVLNDAGFEIRSVDLSEIEKAGGSLRCCVMEVF